MSARPRFPLLLKALVWLLAHLVALALVFAGFVRWQLGLGLDSLLSGAAGERLRAFGEAAEEEISPLPRLDWSPAIRALGKKKGVVADFFDPSAPGRFQAPIPANILSRAREVVPPDAPEGGPGRRGAPPRTGPGPPEWAGPPEGGGRQGGMGFRGGAMSRENTPWPNAVRPVFLARGDGGGYWAGILLHPSGAGGGIHPQLLLLRSDRLDGGGMFFELKPWLWAGTAVLAISILFWAPFMLGITRYLRRLTRAADGIASGDFQVRLPPRSDDELARLGSSIRSMAARLDLLIAGQKRFLGDAAHELCAPLARLRAGIGILEHKLGEGHAAEIEGIDAEAGELAVLIEEILAFSRARQRATAPERIELEPLIRRAAAREQADAALRLEIPAGLAVRADGALLSRAFSNILRNSVTHAGAQAAIRVSGGSSGGITTLEFTDDGPGVPADELPRLFEPFYRPDRSRTRETGGTGLGLAIVRAAAESCGGSVSAFLPAGGGFGVRMELPQGKGPEVRTS